MANIIRKNDPRGSQVGQWEPYRLMRDLFDWEPFGEMRGLERAPLAGFVPSFEVKETKESYVFKCDLPGVDEKDIDITLTGNRLTISGKREAEEREEGDSYYMYERSFGNFTRSFTLPDGVDFDHVDADMKNGVLMVTVPKKPEHQPKKISLKGLAEKVKGAIKGQS
jgi:HSP20 family protein